MRISAVFSAVSPSNIGLENFLRQTGVSEYRVVVLNQCEELARKALERNFPGHRAIVVSGKGRPGGRFIGGVLLIRRIGGVIHAHHTAGAVVAGIARLTGGLSLITTAHSDFTRYRWHQRFAYRFAFWASDRVVCNSEATKRSLPARVDPQKTQVIHNGVDFARLERSLANGRRRGSSGLVTVGAVCRMVRAKDLETLVRGFAEASRRMQGKLALRIVGDGDERARIVELARTLGLGSMVDFAGEVDRDEAYRMLGEMDIFVVSSRWEGFCNAMVEAAGAGKPVIATDIPPLPSIIGRENAMFFSVGNSLQLADRLVELATSQSRRSDLGCRAREYVRRNYSLDVSAERYRRVYQELAVAGQESEGDH